MADRVVNTGFDTEFGGPLQKFRDFLRSKGIETNIISGVRDDEDQRQLVANRNATLARRPLPYPDRGPVYVAAPVGSSAHEYGEAADLQPVNPADAARMHKYAQQFGLQMPNWGGNDPYHVQLANWQQAAATQPPMTAWDQTNPANVPSRMAMNMEAGGPPPGTTLTSFPTDRRQTTPAQRAQFIRNYIQTTYPGKDPNLGIGIAGAEGLNTGGLGASTVDIDPRTGQPFSFGDFQMNVRNGLGNVAQRAGFDPTNPNQWQGVDKFAIDTMYGPKQGYNLAPWKGDKFATAYQQSGVVGSPTIAGGAGTQAQPSGAGAPAAVAGGSPLGTALSGVGKALGGGGDAAGAPATPQSPLTKALSSAGKDLGGGGAGGAGGDEQPPAMPQMQLAPPMVSGAPMMMGAGGQNSFGQRAAQQMLAQQGFQMQPSLQYGGANALPSPIGAPSPGGTPIGAATGIPGLPGTTLNSPSQLQMALMTGQLSPYDIYAQQQGAYGGMNYG